MKQSIAAKSGIPGATTSAYKAHQAQQQQHQPDPYINPSGVGQNYAQVIIYFKCIIYYFLYLLFCF